MPNLPQLHYLTTELPEAEAGRMWREVLSPLFEPLPSSLSRAIPVGSVTGAIVGELAVARVAYNAQNFLRDATRVRSTPDHILLHLYKSGGFTGRITRQQTTIWGGHVAVIDLACTVETQAASSDTTALIVPRKFLAGLPLDRLKPRLDGARNRLLGACISSLRERSAQLEEADVEAAVADTTALIRRILDPSGWDAPIEAACTEGGLRTLAEEVVRNNLALTDLSPDWLAAELQISRATLYRLFAPHGGIMRYVQERRLLAVQAALRDPLERRRLSRLRVDFGFNSEAHFSRSFRARFGVTASEYRKEQWALAARTQLTNPAMIRQWWSGVAT
ncbi:helix-turn-helix domain-containing protein [Methylobacterium sp. ID0610]|uniref:helix-turn-helix domain-containing protein n=1 Tax=Methylobacterium carpenticola TaxID=3344827 RepID=UPI0036880CF0